MYNDVNPYFYEEMAVIIEHKIRNLFKKRIIFMSIEQEQISKLFN